VFGLRRTTHLRPLHLFVALTVAAATAVPAATAAVQNASSDTGQETRAAQLEPAEAATARVDDRPSKFNAFGSGTAPEVYLIRLRDAAVPTYKGELPGLAPTAPPPGERLDPQAPEVQAYRRHLEVEQAEFVDRVEGIAGHEVEALFTYRYAVNGLAVELTAEEAKQVADDPSVASIRVDEERELHTDAGPQWLGADALWDAATQLGLPEDVRGEGMVIGTIDTGISPGNRSFAETGDDGYTHVNPRGPGNYLGACDPDNAEQFDPEFPCNEKLIGAYVFGGANDTALDYDGHGSHTASTSGGNVVDGVVTEAPTLTTEPFDISGVAPHANVISYLGCCTLSGLTMSIDQAIADGVDVINYSIGSSSPSQLWDDFDTVGFLNARAAGIFVATSNGNDGPGFATTGSPADAPWITSVGASTHNRHNGNAVIDLTSSGGDLPDISGKSVTASLPSTPIVNAEDFGNAVCGEGSLDNPINPFPPGTFDGAIVVCDRGLIGRAQKAVHVLEAGGSGIIHVNDGTNGDSLSADAFVIPGVHISFDDGQVLKDWLANGADDHQGAIRGTAFGLDDDAGDIMASFSSRGPNRSVDVIVPDVTAPGVDILAAVGAGSYDVDDHGFISGTSMSSPHVAGAGALLAQARPEWTPAQMQSALMTTARDVLNHDGQPATPYAQGAGHINVDAAVQAGLLFDETHADYLAANPAEGGDPKALNLPSFADTQCLGGCSWQRTATVPASAPAGVEWTASTDADDGLDLTVDLSGGAVSPGDSLDITVTANVSGSPAGETLFGKVTLTPSDPGVPAATMPVAVVPVSGVLPESVEIDTRRDVGSYAVTGIESVEVTEFTGSMLGLVPATLNESALVQDPTRGDPYDDLGQVDVHLVDVPAGATRLVAETVEWEMPDLDLFVGTGDTPSAATQVCASTSSTAAESCEIPDPDAGTWWILIQNWEGTSPGASDSYELAHAVIPTDDLGNGGIAGPAGTIPAGEPYDIRLHWDLPDTQPGDRWYGTAVLGTSPATPDDIGSFPVTIRRADDDVAKTASVDEATTGDTVSYEITIEPNLTPEDLLYTIVDDVPEGLTIDPDSVIGGVVDGQTITWEVGAPTVVGQNGDYVVSTPATSQQCADWSGFVDLGEVGIPFEPLLDGDTTAVNAFGSLGPFEHYGQEFPNLVVAEDGLVTVAGGYGGSPWQPQAIPDPALPNGVMAALWSDLELSVADDRGIRLAVATDLGAAVTQWDDPFEFGGDPTDPASSVGKFQTWVYNAVEDFRPEIVFEYDTLGALPAQATIGLENILGDQAAAVLSAGDPSTVLEDGSSVCFDYEGPSFDPITVGYDVTVDADAPFGTYTNEAVHTTDDPFAQPDVAGFDLEVADSVVAISVSPASARLRPGATQQFSATGQLSAGGTIDVTETATWSSGDESVITVDASGLATAEAGGSTTVTATLGDVSGAADARVSGRPADGGPGPRVATTALPAVHVLETYEASLAAERGTPPYTWAASGLPEGLELDPSSGVIANDPADPAIIDTSAVVVDVTVTDSVGRTAQAELPLGVIGVEQITAGGGYTCAIDEAGVAYCWGGNGNGQLGVGEGDTEDRDLPTPIDTANLDGPVATISTGSSHTCAVTTLGSAYCWGFSGNGQLGTGDTTPRTIPTPVESGEMGAVAEIATGWQHTCAVDTSGAAYCWGSNFFGQLGNGDPPIERHAPWPVDTQALGTVVQIAAYGGHSCAVNADAAGFCWGYNGDGQVGDGSTENRRNPTAVDDSELAAVAQFSLSPFHTCAVDVAGTPYCWGGNSNGQLGDATTTQRPVPTAVATDELGTVREISAGEAHTCAVSTSDEAYCWGYNGSGRLGDGTDTARHVPTPVVADQLGAVEAITAGGAHTCALAATGAAYCWGWNDAGQLGDASHTDRAFPAPVHPGP
jgi:alpha-tubulin suppressor-like RCC1 family protein